MKSIQRALILSCLSLSSMTSFAVPVCECPGSPGDIIVADNQCVYATGAQCKNKQCVVKNNSGQVGDCSISGTGDYCGCKLENLSTGYVSWVPAPGITLFGCTTGCAPGFKCTPFSKTRAGDPTTDVEHTKGCGNVIADPVP